MYNVLTHQALVGYGATYSLRNSFLKDRPCHKLPLFFDAIAEGVLLSNLPGRWLVWSVLFVPNVVLALFDVGRISIHYWQCRRAAKAAERVAVAKVCEEYAAIRKAGKLLHTSELENFTKGS
jgi:hypothetical protein